MSQSTMVVIDGVRYRRDDANRLDLLDSDGKPKKAAAEKVAAEKAAAEQTAEAEAEAEKAPTKTRTAANKARTSADK